MSGIGTGREQNEILLLDVACEFWMASKVLPIFFRHSFEAGFWEEPTLVKDRNCRLNAEGFQKSCFEAWTAENVVGALITAMEEVEAVPRSPAKTSGAVSSFDDELCDSWKAIDDPLSERVMIDVIIGEEGLVLVGNMI